MSSQQINVHYLPRYVTPEDLAGSAVVVIDVLRATTTICQALASGATEVIPFLEIDETLAAAERFGRANVVLGGERKGKRIEGFALGNSPREYTREIVGGKRVLITTTNGTRALAHARLAKRVLVGAIVNLSAVAASLQDEPRIDILCAGTDGEETGEDILAAGGIVSAIRSLRKEHLTLNDAASNWADEWELLSFFAEREQRPFADQLALEFRETPGGRNLITIGLDADLVDCAHLNKLSIAPELDIANWRIHAK
jgi:2-phosphosulfolactate phosphatase